MYDHGHELKEGNVGGSGCTRQRGIKGTKWDNCNSIISKIYFFKNMSDEKLMKIDECESWTYLVFPEHQ